MAHYTQDILMETNPSYHAEHRVTESDVEKANEWVTFIEITRNNKQPEVGDVIQFTNKHGDYYKNAHVEEAGDDLYICTEAGVPFVGEIRGKLYTNTSGGPWTRIPRALTYVGTKEKLFKDWGHCGARGNGAFYFVAEVNVWEYEEADLTYTTKTHDRFHMSYREKPKKEDMDYRYIITRGGAAHTAFRTKEEYDAWLKTFHGVEKEGHWDNTKIVWTYKQMQLCIPREEYDKAVGTIDTTLCNGDVQECKRVIEGTTITTILPYQHERISLKGEKVYRNAYN